ncbi:MAG: hypothetical protein JXR03_10970 [Cyclobacteriaceae bacterium]
MNKLFAVPFLIFLSCQPNKETFGDDLEFLEKYTSIITLSKENSHVILSPLLQGRVLTSSSQGLQGRSYGWFNKKLIKEGFKEKNNALGGEDRIWFGPEFGPYSIFFKAGDEMTGANIRVPAPIDSEPFELVSQTKSSVKMKKEMVLTNYQNYDFEIELKRKVSLLDKSSILSVLDIEGDESFSSVGFVSENILINRGDSAWSKQTGLLSIWTLGGFPPSKKLTVVMPLRQSTDSIVNYWSEVDESRLKIEGKIAYYKGDAEHLHKIGIPSPLAVPILGSYDPERGVLTIVKYTFRGDSTYVNSLWDHHAKPYEGDVINVFNDGPTDDGAGPFGPFYELETSSSTRELSPGDSIVHEHFTFHFEGDGKTLSKISDSLLGVSIEEIEQIFK